MSKMDIVVIKNGWLVHLETIFVLKTGQIDTEFYGNKNIS